MHIAPKGSRQGKEQHQPDQKVPRKDRRIRKPTITSTAHKSTREANKRWVATNRERRRQSQKAWYQQNRDRLLTKHREYDRTHREQNNARHRRVYKQKQDAKVRALLDGL